jgi:hypothetical protein
VRESNHKGDPVRYRFDGRVGFFVRTTERATWWKTGIVGVVIISIKGLVTLKFDDNKAHNLWSNNLEIVELELTDEERFAWTYRLLDASGKNAWAYREQAKSGVSTEPVDQRLAASIEAPGVMQFRDGTVVWYDEETEEFTRAPSVERAIDDRNAFLWNRYMHDNAIAF